MKSKLFSDFDARGHEDFVKDLSAALEGEADLLPRVAASLPAMLATRASTKPLIDQLEKDLSLSWVDLRPLVSIVRFFVLKLNEPEYSEDSPEDLLSDLKALGLVEDGQEDNARLLIKAAVDAAAAYAPTARRDDALKGPIPGLRSVGLSVDLRAVFEPKYNFGSDPNEYEPEATRFAPIISLRLTSSEDSVSPLVVQVDEETLDLLLKRLAAAKKEIVALSRALSLEETKK